MHLVSTPHHYEVDEIRTLGQMAYRMAGFRQEPTAPEVTQTEKADPHTAVGEPGLKDLSHLTWSAIDNNGSRDPDQVVWSERLPNGSVRILVAVADVDALVPQRSALVQRTMGNMTSVYTPLGDYPMLPAELAYDKTVFVPGQDRAALVTEMTVAPDGTLSDSKVYRAVVNNHCQLTYNAVNRWFKKPEGDPQAVPGMAEQLKMQDEAASWMDHGLAVPDNLRSTRLVTKLMTATNRLNAEFLLSHGWPAIVKARMPMPEGWRELGRIVHSQGGQLPDVPDSEALQVFLDLQKARLDAQHFEELNTKVTSLLGPTQFMVAVPGEPKSKFFTMGEPLSARVTGPNRLGPDLVNMRLVKALLDGRPCPYAVGTPSDHPWDGTSADVTLFQVAARATSLDRKATEISRQVEGSLNAQSLQDDIGHVYGAHVTGKNLGGTFVAFDKGAGQGFIRGHSLGNDHPLVCIDSVDVERGRVYLSVVPKSEAGCQGQAGTGPQLDLAPPVGDSPLGGDAQVGVQSVAQSVSGGQGDG